MLASRAVGDGSRIVGSHANLPISYTVAPYRDCILEKWGEATMSDWTGERQERRR